MTSSKQPLRGQPVVKGFFEKRTFSIQYIVADPDTKRAAIIDPVLDFDPKSGSTATHSADEMLECIEREGFTLEWILDTHPHADHSAAGYLKDKTGVLIAIGEKVVEVQRLWKGLNYPRQLPRRRLAVGPPLQGRRALHYRQHGCRGAVYAGPHLASIARDRRCRLHPRHDLHAGRRHRPRGLRAARPTCCGTASNASWRCRTRRGCSPGTITCRADGSRAGRARCRAAGEEHAPHEGEDRGCIRGPTGGATESWRCLLILHALQVNIRADACLERATASGTSRYRSTRSKGGLGSERSIMTTKPA